MKSINHHNNNFGNSKNNCTNESSYRIKNNNH